MGTQTTAPGTGRRRAATVALFVSLLAVLASGCASAPPDRAEVVRALRTSGIPASQARCAADAIYDNLSDEQVRQLVERGNGGTPKDDPTRTDDALEKLNTAMAACRDLTTPTTTGPPSTAPSISESLDTVPGTDGSTTTSPPVGSTDPPSPTPTTITGG